MFHKNLIFTLFIYSILNNFLYTQQLLYKIISYDSQGIIKSIAYRESIQDNPENVLVLYNINDLSDKNNNNIWDSYEIASYYQTIRNIPSANVFGIKAPTSPSISREQYDSYFDNTGQILGIRQQIESILNLNFDQNDNPLRTVIKYIVLCKGIPHRIESHTSSDYGSADYGSVDAAVALIFNGNYDITWRLSNPYYAQDPYFEGTSPFIPEFYMNPDGIRLSYLVCRLDGYYVEDVKR